MSTFTNSTLNTLDRFSHKLGPVNTLLNKIMDRFVPQATAHACTPGGGLVGVQCINVRCGHFDTASRAVFGNGCVLNTCGGC
ncbi:MAG TPA: hypothetical protein VFN35_02295 [Ktedonobacteraceae bacterium]|nr:hypothetical protein [Ktedonobacteraceae bacterium]